MQVPPSFSAIKIDGNRAYDLARDGEEVALEARPVAHRGLQLVDMPDADTAVLEARLRQGHVRARPRPRHGPPARLLRARHRAAAHARRRLRRGLRGDASPSCEAAAQAGEEALAALLLPVEAALDALPGLA